jgi:hypothetical protein
VQGLINGSERVDKDRWCSGAGPCSSRCSARTPPPSIDPEVRSAEDGTVRAVAAPLRPEDAPWNQWATGGARLFNDRVALLFSVRIEGTGPIRWVPAATRLEVNDAATSIGASSSGELLLGELLVNAYLEERHGLDGELVDRTRAAGPFRAEYLPLASADGVLEGVLAFPLVWDGRAIGDAHIVALRLTVGVVGERDGAATLVWVFE